MNSSVTSLIEDSLQLLSNLVATPSFSREEDATADLLVKFLEEHGVCNVERIGNNVIAYSKFFQVERPTILLNSHHDTVKPNSGYTNDPFLPIRSGGKLYGLGSNDAGGCLVSLIATFLHFYEVNELKYNLCLVASAEEEISGRNGIEQVYQHIVPCEFAIVGEPTLLDLAIAEKGLMVLDCVAQGQSGHAAREEGVNAIYKAVEDIRWFNSYQFPKQSAYLGPVKMSVTMIEAGTQHNVVPSSCKFVVDVRTTDVYTNEEVLELIREHVQSEVTARSTRLNPSTIAITHPIVQAGQKFGKKLYGSPTMSDQALLPIPSLKVGPGDSARSHAADEYIYEHEVAEGIAFYIQLLDEIIR